MPDQSSDQPLEGPTRSRAATEEASGSRRDRERPPAPEPLPLPVVDNHCHLDIADGDWVETSAAIRRARDVNVARIVQIGCDLPGARWAVEAAAEHAELVAGVALHPNEAPRVDDLDAAMAEIERAGRRPRQGPGGRGDRARPLPHRRGRSGRAGGVASGGTSTWPSGWTRRWSSTTATPTTTSSG